MGFVLGLLDTAHGLENENLDRPCRSKAPAGPAPQDARYPQSRRLRFRLRHQPRALRARRYLGRRTRPTNELLYEALRGQAETGNIALRFWLQGFGGGFDPLPRLDGSLLGSAVSKYLGHFPEGLVEFHILIDALDCPALGHPATVRAAAGTVALTTANDVFLDTV